MTRSRTWSFALLMAGASLAVSYTASAQTAGRREARFRIFVQGFPVGGESIVVETTATEWKMTATGQTTAAILNNAQVRYDRQWRPLGFELDGRLKDSPVRITTTIAGGTATSTVIQGDKSFNASHQIADNSILLPNNVYGSYEAVVARLATLQPGATFRAYVVPQAEIDVKYESVTTERVQTTARTFQSKHYVLSAQNPGGALRLEVWADDRDQLMRLRIPQANLEVSRDDIAVVSTRQQTTFRPNDEDVRMLANGFNLAGTISKPAPPADAPPPPTNGKAPKTKPVKLPAIILVAGSGNVDRDETVAGIPIFAQLAGALADAGYLVVRYDKRGLGQSGGRVESATLTDYAEDVRAVVRYLSDRKDVDDKRISVVGHSEGASVAMLAAQREKKIRALVLMAGPGTTGAELILEQQRHALDRSKLSDDDRQARIGLQLKIQAAALSGQGWDGIPPEMRRSAETPWFSSLLQFDPAKVMEKLKQPILIVQGDLDMQVPAHHADKLAALAKARKKAPDVQLARFPSLNHLLVSAKTGEIDEYATLEAKAIAPDVPTKIVSWLNTAVAPKT
jgi:pimeloyl-ACP methyl ester carboxylesterase